MSRIKSLSYLRRKQLLICTRIQMWNPKPCIRETGLSIWFYKPAFPGAECMFVRNWLGNLWLNFWQRVKEL